MRGYCIYEKKKKISTPKAQAIKPSQSRYKPKWSTVSFFWLSKNQDSGESDHMKNIHTQKRVVLDPVLMM